MESSSAKSPGEAFRYNRTLRVLVVDDVGVMRLLVRNNLRTIGIENVMLATNGREALGLFSKWRFDLVLTDWSMPLMDGLSQNLPNVAEIGGSSAWLAAVATSRLSPDPSADESRCEESRSAL